MSSCVFVCMYVRSKYQLSLTPGVSCAHTCARTHIHTGELPRRFTHTHGHGHGVSSPNVLTSLEHTRLNTSTGLNTSTDACVALPGTIQGENQNEMKIQIKNSNEAENHKLLESAVVSNQSNPPPALLSPPRTVHWISDVTNNVVSNDCLTYDVMDVASTLPFRLWGVLLGQQAVGGNSARRGPPLAVHEAPEAVQPKTVAAAII